MVARDLGTKRVTSPVVRAENPDYNEDDGSPKYLPSEPHIGATESNDPKPKIVQTGYSRGGTTNPPEGESGDVEIVVTDETGSKIAGHDQGDLIGLGDDAHGDIEDQDGVTVEVTDAEIDPYLETDPS